MPSRAQRTDHSPTFSSSDAVSCVTPANWPIWSARSPCGRFASRSATIARCRRNCLDPVSIGPVVVDGRQLTRNSYGCGRECTPNADERRQSEAANCCSRGRFGACAVHGPRSEADARAPRVRVPSDRSLVQGQHLRKGAPEHWQCTLERVVAGDRIRVAAALVEHDGESVVVVTVMR